MTKTARHWWWGLILAVASAGCSIGGKPAERIDYYVLEYEAPQPPGLPAVEEVLRVERFGVAPPYNTARIVYRESAFERDTYNYHRWRANPGDLVTYFLARDLRESGLFAAVLPGESRFSASCVLEGVVEEFYEHDHAERWDAVLGVSVSLIAEGEPDVSRRVLHQASYREAESCLRKNPRALSEAMSRAMERVSIRILLDVHEALVERREAGSSGGGGS